jgi:hypothetical protein
LHELTEQRNLQLLEEAAEAVMTVGREDWKETEVIVRLLVHMVMGVILDVGVIVR